MKKMTENSYFIMRNKIAAYFVIIPLQQWQLTYFTLNKKDGVVYGPPSPGSATPRLAKSFLVDVDMASSGRRSSPGSPNSTLGEEDPFPGP